MESPNVTRLHPEAPIFWDAAEGANVRDVDGNIFIDMTAGFGVAAAGHSHPAVAAAIALQAARMAHGLGDVHPSRLKVELLEALARIAPGDLNVSILGSAGSEAVEAALKTAVMRTGKTSIIAFEQSYHGLTYGALATTHRQDFREPFEGQLFQGVHFLPFPTTAEELEPALEALDDVLSINRFVGAIMVEPIQGRGGIRLPAPGFLQALRDRCHPDSCVLIFDEIYTGMGRTGHWFACQHFGVTPDILLVGKGLTGSIAMSAAIGSKIVMSAWPASTGEAIHTSTFLGNPLACAAALAQIDAIEQSDLLSAASRIGAQISARTEHWASQFKSVRNTRGLGALQAVEFEPASEPAALRLSDYLLKSGIIALPEGTHAEVLALTPPLTISEAQLDHVLTQIEAALTPSI